MTDRFDDAIDRVARDMTDVEPEAGLRGRVLARLDEPVPAIFTWPRMVAAGAAAAVLIAALVTFHAPERATESTVATHEAPVSARAPETQQKEAAVPASDPVPRAATPTARSRMPDSRASLVPRRQAFTASEPEERLVVAAVAADEAIDTIPLLDEIAPIPVSRALDMERIELVEIVLVPVEIPALEVRPLSTDETSR